MPDRSLSTIQDPARLSALRHFALSQDSPEPAFDRPTQLAAKVLRAPIALTCFVDADRQFFKSCLGLPEPWASLREVPLSHSFCKHVVLANEPLIVDNAQLHPLVRDNLAIDALGVMSYAGIPLTTREGHVLGSFCVIDRVPRTWTPVEIDILQDLAALVIYEIEQRNKLIERIEIEESLRRANATLETQIDALLAEVFQSNPVRNLRANTPAVEISHSTGVDYRTLVEQIPAIVYINDLGVVCSTLYMSPQVKTILGYDPNECMADPFLWSKIIHPDDRDWVDEECAKANATGEPLRCEYRMIAQDGRIVWVRDEAVLVRDVEGRPKCWQGVIHDITARRLLEERLTLQAFYDPLTKLPNRTLCLDRLQQCLKRAEENQARVAVLFLDMDNFKFINDSLGHRAGDELLVAVAKRLCSCLPQDAVARLGGDEFIVVLETIADTSDAIAITEQILDCLRSPVILNGQEIDILCSIGIAISAIGKSRIDDMLRDADAAMYHAKTTSKHYAVFAPEMHVRRVNRSNSLSYGQPDNVYLS